MMTEGEIRIDMLAVFSRIMDIFYLKNLQIVGQASHVLVEYDYISMQFLEYGIGVWEKEIPVYQTLNRMVTSRSIVFNKTEVFSYFRRSFGLNAIMKLALIIGKVRRLRIHDDSAEIYST